MIYEDDPAIFRIVGSAEIVVTHVDLDADRDGVVDTDVLGNVVTVTSGYMTATGEISIGGSDTTVQMGLDNPYYALVVLDVNPGDPVILRINGEDASETDDGASLYNYVTSQKTGILAIDFGQNNAAGRIDTSPNVVYNLATGESNDELFVIALDFSYPLVPDEGDGVINPRKIVAATDISIDEETGAVSGFSAGIAVNAYYQGAGRLLSAFKDFKAEVSFTEDTDIFINVYLRQLNLDGETPEFETFQAIYYPLTQQVRVVGTEDVYDSFMEFATSLKYSLSTVRRDYFETYPGLDATDEDKEVFKDITGFDIQSVRGNFFLRLGDSNYENSGDEFVISTWGLQPSPVLPLNQIVGAENLQVSDGVITGDIPADEGSVVRAHVKVDGRLPLSRYEWSFEGIDTPADKSFVNIYLEEPDAILPEKKRASFLIGSGHGQYAGKYELDTHEIIDEAEFREQFNEWIVREYIEISLDGSIVGNFVWRSSDSSSPNGNEGGSFSIPEYSVVVETLPLDQIIGAAPRSLQESNGVISGDIRETDGSIVRAYAEVDGDLPLSAYEWSFWIETPTDRSFVNIYLEDPDDSAITRRANFLVGTGFGSNSGLYEMSDVDPFEYLTEADLRTYGVRSRIANKACMLQQYDKTTADRISECSLSCDIAWRS